MAKTLIDPKDIRTKGGFAFVLSDGFALHTSDREGPGPLLTLYDASIHCEDFAVSAHKVAIAEAFLLLALRVKEVEADEIGADALELLKDNGIKIKCETIIPEPVDPLIPGGALTPKVYPGQALLVIQNAYHPKKPKK